MPQLAERKITQSAHLKKTSESKIQSKIASQWRREGWIVVKLGISAPGMPDLMCLRNGVTEFIEVKALGQVRSPLQRKVARDLEEQGFKVFCLTQDGAAVVEEPIDVQDFGF